ncbi:plasmalemma vesicle associated protein b [Nelusetta ayraudi]|uniref:plasmalemma vesicle associated protein b n=1 Tax=Nelusetta ayraudi TaxID=303726 RepID=UPI003F702C61
MYNSSYSRAKFARDAREPLHRSRGKSCGYYMRIVFFFSSLIQSLIIVSLVLFLIYGQPEKSAEEKRVEDLEMNFNRLSENNIQLRKEKADLGAQLKARTDEKDAVEKEFAKFKTEANGTEFVLRGKLFNCERTNAATVSMLSRRTTTPIHQPPVLFTANSEVKTLQSLNAQQKAMISLIEANFTQHMQYLNQERDIVIRERDKFNYEAIALRRENAMLTDQLAAYTRKCKEDFAHSLDGIKMVTRDFLGRINSLFPQQLTFHLTCDSQRDYMDKIRNSCTNLSRDVENKFQLYLNRVGDKVSEIQSRSAQMEVQNNHLDSDLKQCEHKRKDGAAEAANQLQNKQKSHDDQVEKLLIEQNRLREQKSLLEGSLALKEKELQLLQRAAPAQPKFGLPKTPGLPTSLQPNGQNVPKWPSPGAPVLSKTPVVG